MSLRGPADDDDDDDNDVAVSDSDRCRDVLTLCRRELRNTR